MAKVEVVLRLEVVAKEVQSFSARPKILYSTAEKQVSLRLNNTWVATMELVGAHMIPISSQVKFTAEIKR